MKVGRKEYLGMACLTGALLLQLAAPAQSADIQLELNKCSGIADITARVACYDNLARPAQSRPQTKAPEAVGVETFGQPTAKPESEDRREEALLARVTSVKEVRPDKLQITLANGQVWQQTVGKAFFIRTNDTVRIAPSGWGRSFRLAIDGHADYIQVSRLK